MFNKKRALVSLLVVVATFAVVETFSVHAAELEDETVIEVTVDEDQNDETSETASNGVLESKENKKGLGSFIRNTIGNAFGFGKKTAEKSVAHSKEQAKSDVEFGEEITNDALDFSQTVTNDVFDFTKELTGDHLQFGQDITNDAFEMGKDLVGFAFDIANAAGKNEDFVIDDKTEVIPEVKTEVTLDDPEYDDIDSDMMVDEAPVTVNKGFFRSIANGIKKGFRNIANTFMGRVPMSNK